MLSSSLSAYRPRTATSRIILHDSHTPPSCRSATHFMRNKALGMGLLDIGYHVVIERSGRAVFCRQLDTVGCHTPGGANLHSVSICLAGGRDAKGEPSDNFTLEQMETLGALTLALRRRYGLSVDDIAAHSEVIRRKGPACPYLNVDGLRQELRAQPEDQDTMHLPEVDTPLQPLPKLEDLRPQQRTIIEYLTEHGALTNMHAMNSLGIGSVTSRVAELRNLGFAIVSTPKTDFHGNRYVSYSMAAEKETAK